MESGSKWSCIQTPMEIAVRIETCTTEDHQFTMKAVLGPFDGIPPVQELVLGGRPLRCHPDRLGLAAYLAFGPYVSGEFMLPSAVGPEVASAVEDDCRPIRVRPGPVEYEPRIMVRGQRSVLVRHSRTSSPDSNQIQIVPGVSANGCFRWDDSIAVSSNAFIFNLGPRAVLAVAVLFAEDLNASELRLEAGHSLDAKEEALLRQLLLSVGLGFSVAHSESPKQLG